MWIVVGRTQETAPISGGERTSLDCARCGHKSMFQEVAIQNSLHIFFLDIGKCVERGYKCTACGMLVQKKGVRREWKLGFWTYAGVFCFVVVPILSAGINFFAQNVTAPMYRAAAEDDANRFPKEMYEQYFDGKFSNVKPSGYFNLNGGQTRQVQYSSTKPLPIKDAKQYTKVNLVSDKKEKAKLGAPKWATAEYWRKDENQVLVQILTDSNATKYQLTVRHTD
jgi:hypothetical protein